VADALLDESKVALPADITRVGFRQALADDEAVTEGV
jgi:hypothetical protein